MDKWTPAKEGAEFELMPIMQPLAPFKNQMTILSGLPSAARSSTG